MRAAVCTAYGPPEVVQLRDVPKPAPRRNEVCIRVCATSVTTSDTRIRGLQFPLKYRVALRLALSIPAPRRSILGLVLSGDVESVGPGVTSFKEGDQVLGFDVRLRFGAHAEYVCWPADDLLALRPASLTHEEAAAIPYGGLLATHFLRRAGVRRGHRIAVYGASGSIGTAAAQLARQLGTSVTGVCSGANFDLVRSLGAASCVDYTVEDFTASGVFYDVVLDAVGRRKSAVALRSVGRALAPAGVCVSVDDGRPRMLMPDLQELILLASAGSLRPVIDRTYPLEQIVEAHRYVDKGHKRGNVLLTVAAQAAAV